MMNFLKKLFGSEEVIDVENSTSHPNPDFKQLPGDLFKKEYVAAKDSAVLLDVRTAAEVQGGALPKATNIDFMSMSFKNNIAGLDKAKTYFVYCRSGNRSAQACNTMHKMGFDVRNLMGGIGAWPR
jgi:rhodanese-related sulfurtransferase